jgi:hypothetical protein
MIARSMAKMIFLIMKKLKTFKNKNTYKTIINRILNKYFKEKKIK